MKFSPSAVRRNTWQEGCLEQFSDLSTHENLRGLAKTQAAGPQSPQLLTQFIWGGAWEFAFLTHSQVMLKTQVQGPHFENQPLRTVEQCLAHKCLKILAVVTMMAILVFLIAVKQPPRKVARCFPSLTNISQTSYLSPYFLWPPSCWMFPRIWMCPLFQHLPLPSIPSPNGSLNLSPAISGLVYLEVTQFHPLWAPENTYPCGPRHLPDIRGSSVPTEPKRMIKSLTTPHFQS